MTVSLRITEKRNWTKTANSLNTSFSFLSSHTSDTREKWRGKKTNKLNSILSQETLISQDNNTLADDLVRGKEKEDIAATVPQRKPEHWREQGISCGPSTAMQVCVGEPLDAILTAANSEEGRAQTRRLHFKTCTQPAVSPREVRSIRVALHKRSVCHLRACARERNLVHEACNLYKCGRCSAPTSAPCQTNDHMQTSPC